VKVYGEEKSWSPDTIHTHIPVTSAIEVFQLWTKYRNNKHHENETSCYVMFNVLFYSETKSSRMIESDVKCVILESQIFLSNNLAIIIFQIARRQRPLNITLSLNYRNSSSSPIQFDEHSDELYFNLEHDLSNCFWHEHYFLLYACQ
jgi:hypothetical protein